MTTRPTVLLEHRLPDGSSHVDWLIASRTARSLEDRCVWTWRLDHRPDTLGPGDEIPTTRLPDHRSVYLDHEGPVPPAGGVDRGTVRRLARGLATIESLDGPVLTITIVWTEPDSTPSTHRYRLDDGKAIVRRLDPPTPEFPKSIS